VGFNLVLEKNKKSITKVILMFILLMLVFPAYVESQTQNVIAVEDFSANGVQDSDAKIITDRLRSELIQVGVFRVMERSQMNVILQEQSFQASGACNSSECLVEMGQVLGVDRMIVGVVGKIGTLYTLSARILNVETGEILFTVSEDFEGEISDFLGIVVPKVANKISNASAFDLDKMDLENKFGVLHIESSIEGSTIFVNGEEIPGKTPLTLENFKAGKHLVSVRKGRFSGEQTVILLPDDFKKLKIEMSEDQGAIKVFSDPPGARVSVDGHNFGETPVKIDTLPIGEITLNLSKSGFLDYTQSFVIRANEVSEAKIKLSPAAYLLLEGFSKEILLRVNQEEKSFNDESQMILCSPGDLFVEFQSEGYDTWGKSFRLNVGDSLILINVSNESNPQKFSKQKGKQVIPIRMQRSKEWLDAKAEQAALVAAANRKKLKLGFRFSGSVIAIGGGVLALVANNKLQESRMNVAQIAKEYDESSSGFVEIKDRYENESEKAKELETFRLIGLVSGGLGLGFVGISFAF